MSSLLSSPFILTSESLNGLKRWTHLTLYNLTFLFVNQTHDSFARLQYLSLSRVHTFADVLETRRSPQSGRQCEPYEQMAAKSWFTSQSRIRAKSVRKLSRFLRIVEICCPIHTSPVCTIDRSIGIMQSFLLCLMR